MDDLSSSPILAKDVMDPEAVPLTPGKFDKDLALQFLSGQYTGWPVVDSTRRILGIVTELCLFQAYSRVQALDDLRVEDIMSSPAYVSGNDELDVVMKLMVLRQVLRMPVVENQKLIGVISRREVLRHCLPMFSTPTKFAFSCVWCERIHDPSDEPTGTEEWRGLSSFLATHHLTFSNIDFMQTYCPSCLQTLKAVQSTSQSLSHDTCETEEVPQCLLVVDDDPAVAGMLEQALQAWGYDVYVARNGREGLDVVCRYQVDGILLDMHMPVMDGRTMLDELRWLGHQMPVLMMSGASEEKSLRELLREGAQGYFVKPFQLASLQKACRRFIHSNGEGAASACFHVA
jgi:CheY-like chemotaxis protein/CBS domain-containing protein